MPSKVPRGQYWAFTLYPDTFGLWVPHLPEGAAYIKGQLEECPSTKRLHWQGLIYFKERVRRTLLNELLPKVHVELTRSDAIENYVEKEKTAIPGTGFELGSKPHKRNSKTDWDAVRENAKRGRLDDIPADVYVQHYGSLCRIAKDHMRGNPQEKEVFVFWGDSGTGKSKRAWEEAGMDAYPKDPNTKYWDGYQGEENVVIDEFTGAISISHILRWTDRYPVLFENKFGGLPSRVKRFWITSNLSPEEWYPTANSQQHAAIRRRMTITHFNKPI